MTIIKMIIAKLRKNNSGGMAGRELYCSALRDELGAKR